MSYQVLYRTYRPAKFNEVVGQEYIVKTDIDLRKKDLDDAYRGLVPPYHIKSYKMSII